MPRNVTVDDNPSGQIQDGIDLAGPTATVQILSGTYSENIDASAKIDHADSWHRPGAGHDQRQFDFGQQPIP